MLVKQLLPKNDTIRKIPEGVHFLNVSELYCDTIQGEGVYTGCPATFLRLQNCVMNCDYCDSTEVWRKGNPYTLDELYDAMYYTCLDALALGQHLVITGGSPLLQQENLYHFINGFKTKFGFLPFIEIENECVIQPHSRLVSYIDCWNNSPKLSSSVVPERIRYRPDIIKTVASFPNSWFKFVICREEDWEEIDEMFLGTELIHRVQVILMPEGSTREELIRNQEMVIDMAIGNNVRYSSREHIMIWNKKTGV